MAPGGCLSSSIVSKETKNQNTHTHTHAHIIYQGNNTALLSSTGWCGTPGTILKRDTAGGVRRQHGLALLAMFKPPPLSPPRGRQVARSFILATLRSYPLAWSHQPTMCSFCSHRSLCACIGRGLYQSFSRLSFLSCVFVHASAYTLLTLLPPGGTNTHRSHTHTHKLSLAQTQLSIPLL